jgi:hypothetical protein
MIGATSIELFKNMAQYDYNNQYYDLHNNYDCERLSVTNGILLLTFRSTLDAAVLSLKFTDVEITLVDFFNIKEVKSLTIDNIYRGRILLNGELQDSNDGKGYFYLEFYEGQKLEFWAKNVGIDHH